MCWSLNFPPLFLHEKLKGQSRKLTYGDHYSLLHNRVLTVLFRFSFLRLLQAIDYFKSSLISQANQLEMTTEKCIIVTTICSCAVFCVFCHNHDLRRPCFISTTYPLKWLLKTKRFYRKLETTVLLNLI